ncbi:hypothetical protein Tco_0912620 [Tanacetum coccineum]
MLMMNTKCNHSKGDMNVEAKSSSSGIVFVPIITCISAAVGNGINTALWIAKCCFEEYWNYLAKAFFEALGFSRYTLHAGIDMSITLMCSYHGKVVDHMIIGIES